MRAAGRTCRHYNDSPGSPVRASRPGTPMASRIPDTNAVQPRIAWEDWSAAAFDRAARERKPVLLSIGASWCHGCAVMDRTTYADPVIVETSRAETVPIRVDADRRPDLNERYNLEGWPTTALLTPSGEILTGSTYVTPGVMPRMLIEATRALREHYDELMERAAAAAAARRAKPMLLRYEPDTEAPEWVAAQIVAGHDAEHGGFGAGGKFLQAATLRFTLDRAAAGDTRLGDILMHTLDAIVRGGIVDEVDGGFFRYASGRDWSRPH